MGSCIFLKKPNFRWRCWLPDELAPPVHKNLKIHKTDCTRISGNFRALEIPKNQFWKNNPWHWKATLNFEKYFLGKINYSRISGYFQALEISKNQFWKILFGQNKPLQNFGLLSGSSKMSVSIFGLQSLTSKCTPAWPRRDAFG